MSPSPSALLADHPDRIRWNAKYECADPTEAVFAPKSWLGDVLQFGVPEGRFWNWRAVGPAPRWG